MGRKLQDRGKERERGREKEREIERERERAAKKAHTISMKGSTLILA